MSSARAFRTHGGRTASFVFFFFLTDCRFLGSALAAAFFKSGTGMARLGQSSFFFVINGPLLVARFLFQVCSQWRRIFAHAVLVQADDGLLGSSVLGLWCFRNRALEIGDGRNVRSSLRLL